MMRFPSTSTEMGTMGTAAIIPVHDNEATVGDVISEAKKHVDALIAVDDGSTDGTARWLRKAADRKGCVVLSHRKNRGKGAAIRTALSHLRAMGGRPEAVVFLDADGEHDPRDIPRLIAALGQADFVLGERASHRSWTRRCLNSWMGAWFRLLDGNIKDPSCGLRAARWETLRKLDLRSTDFSIDAEMILEAVKIGASIASVRISPAANARSSVSRRDFILMNCFFDRWVLRNARQIELSPVKRLLLLAGSRVGDALGTALLNRADG